MTLLQQSIDNYAAGVADGQTSCESTHAALTESARGHAWEAGYEDGEEDGSRRGEARGRVEGAVIVAVIVGLAVWWRKR